MQGSKDEGGKNECKNKGRKGARKAMRKRFVGKRRGKAPNRHIKERHINKVPKDPGSSNKNVPNPSKKQSWEAALRPGTAGKWSSPVPGKYSFMFACFLSTDEREKCRKVGIEERKITEGRKESTEE